MQIMLTKRQLGVMASDREIGWDKSYFYCVADGQLGLKAGATTPVLTTTFAEATITLADAIDIVVNATTGTKIGTATTQKLGFWNKTPVVQPAAAAQAALTDSTGGATDGTLAAVGATNGSDVSAAINNNFADIALLVNAIRTALVNTGIMKGAA